MMGRFKDFRTWFIVLLSALPSVLTALGVGSEIIAAITTISTIVAGWIGVRMPTSLPAPNAIR